MPKLSEGIMGGMLVVAALALAGPVSADAYRRVAERDAFLDLVEGRDLRLPLFGVTLKVQEDGTIAGEAMGWTITGTWTWQDGYFCREMDWSGYAIAPNCQLVEVNGRSMRFTVDRGAGTSASFRLR